MRKYILVVRQNKQISLSKLKIKNFILNIQVNPKFETYPILINNKMEIVAVKKYKYTGSAFTYKLNKIEKKLNVKFRNKQGRIQIIGILNVPKNKNMKKYLVIGNPIEHSLSPKLHNYWLNKNKIDGDYDKKLLTEEKVEEFLKLNQNVSGINVTVPFKKTVINYCTELTTLASSSQSVNTIILSNNKIIGDNTDIYGLSNH